MEVVMNYYFCFGYDPKSDDTYMISQETAILMGLKAGFSNPLKQLDQGNIHVDGGIIWAE
jgi:hypothetical protein